MKVLIVSTVFPPLATIGALRIGSYAETLYSAGHDVQVITAASKQASSSWSPADFPEERVHRIGWFDLSHLRVISQANLAPTPSLESQGQGGNSQRLSARVAARTPAAMARIYRNIVEIPDPLVGWIPRALRAVPADWTPDVILASGPHFSSFLVASFLHRRLDRPWVADYRDLWTDRYFPYSRPRLFLDRSIERKVLRTASAALCVSDVHASMIQKTHGITAHVVLNGGIARPSEPAHSDRSPLGPALVNVLYVGSAFYKGRRDPTPLFRAAAECGLTRDDIRFHFLGSPREELQGLARNAGVETLVEVYPSVPRETALEFERRADLLLLLLWDSPGDEGVYSGKIFEYLFAGRPILLVGRNSGVAADLIRERQAGWVARDRIECREVLQEILSLARTSGLKALPAEATKGLTRSDQNAIMQQVLLDTVGESSIRQGAG